MSFYKKKLDKHGLTAKGAGWDDENRPVNSYRKIYEKISNELGARGGVIDFGCGTGIGMNVLKEYGYRCEYIGVDREEVYIEKLIEEHPDVRWKTSHDFYHGGVTDYPIVCSGVFTLRDHDSDHMQLVSTVLELKKISSMTTGSVLITGFYINAVDYRDPKLYYWSLSDLQYAEAKMSKHVLKSIEVYDNYMFVAHYKFHK